jgi:Protein of unknown function (DUF1592)/Protein of unknown function (DUF1588)/Protein of unknown function (DUF1595)/Protein of unknown function (DUF1585)/Protein of unknown function (DUF1587)
MRVPLLLCAVLRLHCAKPAQPAPLPEPDPPLCSDAAPTATPLRLLTRDEFDNTVAALLGTRTLPGRALPKEPLSHGLDNDATLNKVTAEGVGRYLETAEALAAEAVATHKADLVTCNPQQSFCASQLLAGVGRRAYRRPLSAEESAALTTLFDTVNAAEGFDVALEQTLQVLLQSPQFLYRTETGRVLRAGQKAARLTGFELASKLSFFLWAQAPDDALLDSAEVGELDTLEGLTAAAKRMLEDPRAALGKKRFLGLWLNLDAVERVEKDTAIFPMASPALSRAWRTSLELYLEDVFSKSGTLAGLLGTNVLFANDTLQPYVTGAAPNSFSRFEMPAGERVGVLAQPGLLSLLAGPNQGSPIRRGIFVLDKLMCQPPPPPPADAAIVPPTPSSSATTRERFAQHTQSPSCAGCHRFIDPVGFTFEHYDGVGLRREVENGLPIDARGGVVEARDQGLVAPVADLPELAARLGSSRQVHDCVAQEWLRFALGRPLDAADACALKTVQDAFMSAGGSFDALLLAIATSESFRGHAVEGTP